MVHRTGIRTNVAPLCQHNFNSQHGHDVNASIMVKNINDLFEKETEREQCMSKTDILFRRASEFDRKIVYFIVFRNNRKDENSTHTIHKMPNEILSSHRM